MIRSVIFLVLAVVTVQAMNGGGDAFIKDLIAEHQGIDPKNMDQEDCIKDLTKAFKDAHDELLREKPELKNALRARNEMETNDHIGLIVEMVRAQNAKWDKALARCERVQARIGALLSSEVSNKDKWYSVRDLRADNYVRDLQ